MQNVAELNRGLIRVIGSKFSQRAAEGRLKGLRLLCVYMWESRICAALCVSLGAASFSLCLQLYLALARVLSATAISGVYFIRESATTRLPRVSSVITEQPTVQIARLVLKDAADWLLWMLIPARFFSRRRRRTRRAECKFPPLLRSLA